MLQNIRDNAQGTIAKIIIAIIIVPFAAFGIDSLFTQGGSEDVAEVNGQEISAQELAQAIEFRRRQLINMMGDKFDPALVEEDKLRGPAMEGLIEKTLLLQAADKLGVHLGTSTIDQSILGMAQFQEDGQFSAQLYENVLRTNGFTPSLFKGLLREELTIEQLRSGIAETEIIVDPELEAAVRLAEQKRDFRYMIIPVKSVQETVTVSNEAIEAYYNDNQDQFLSSEKVRVNYVTLSINDFFKPVDEQLLIKEYESEVAAFESSQRRRVSHILLEINADRDEAASLAKAKSILDEINSGKSFVDAAESYSDDIGSASMGGDLGFTEGDTFDETFEQALASLSENEVSEPVVTDAGVHIIKVTEIDETAAPGFLERKEQIQARLQRDAAEPEFLRTLETLKDLVFNAENLTSPANELGLEVASSDWFDRNSGAGVLANPKVVAAVFSEELVENGHNSDVIEVGVDEYVVARVAAHEPSKVKALDEVKAEIKDIVAQRLASERINEEAEKMLGMIKSSADIEALAKEKAYEWQVEIKQHRYGAGVNREILSKAFDLQLDDAPFALETLTLSNGDAAVLMLESIEDGKLADVATAQKNAIQSGMQRAQGIALTEAFKEIIKTNAEIEVF